jgi:uncharacterized protein (DUF697 family)
MDIRDEMLKKIVAVHMDIMNYELFDYTSISKKRQKNLFKIDPYFNFDKFVAMIDTTVFNTAKEGIVFMTNGIYIKSILFPVYFINYVDIKSTYFGKGQFIIETITNGNIEYIDTCFEKEKGCSIFSELLKQLSILSLENDNGYSDIATGKVDKKMKLTKEEAINSNLIIHLASASTVIPAAGLAQIPLSDTLIITPIQIGMIMAIGASFGISASERAAKAIIAGVTMSFIGRGISQVLIGIVPIVGNVLNVTTAVALTQSIGWIAVRHFKVVQKGGFFEGLKVGNIQVARQFEQKFRQQAKEFVEKEKILKSQANEWATLIGDYVQLIADYITDPENKKYHKNVKELKKELKKLQSLKVVQG